MSEIEKTEQLHHDWRESENERKMLSDMGYSQKAIEYYIRKPYMTALVDADHVSEMTGTCGDTMKISLKIRRGMIEDVGYQVLGCPGAVASAMAVVDLIKGGSLENAGKINDNDVFKALEDMPAKKHHCIQLSVKTLHKAVDEYRRKESKIKTIN
ncbi:MAG: iron-sulfur cluster assembly scaffold protein [Desulfamplus sp.]|nr:iron-sulfur cluster assembly scaffold protein [Desulfamplus sp.]